MSNQEIIKALRCTSSADSECIREQCPFFVQEVIPEELRGKYGGKDKWDSCDVDGVALAAADRLEELAGGHYIKLPFVAMVEQSLKDGKMTPQKDQSNNGRYAVVYSDPKKWTSPLIDICGKHYDRGEAEARMEELLEGGKE